ncbi:hypothetical protein HCBG_04331 [Histoplasma capsulatum G186AR]|uniref:Uncharacterized protein n=1 Tax=Ajellomyces capsulatus (strain G186AR / H82 / ATCC MYA-2454 / RMSCC 2432) TaxID=447093 RepID=C0NLF1_AJECG|nr:uncharacterized protein HCBG_04331 [Histoplasma capsulatum G186AR]EEH07452.1 hypothetical protein HCBG_04331 [Histoplasma capsulatum G186AR]
MRKKRGKSSQSWLPPDDLSSQGQKSMKEDLDRFYNYIPHRHNFVCC